jgi:hypothetical protein
MRKVLLLIASTAVILAPLQAALADVPVIDDDAETERADDNDHSETDTKTQIDKLEGQTVTNCNISQKEKNRRLYRSPANAVAEDAGNVELIKHYAEKYDVPGGLALSVAHAESGISTCSGSPTGVKGVMQLTKKTGAGMGFDRDINEENIEGGVKYLGLGVNKCGSTNYTCLASWYNGSTASEQANWAGKVGRNHGWFNAYSGGTNIAEISSPAFKTGVDYGSSATRGSNAAGVKAVNSAVSGLDSSTGKVQEANTRIAALSSSVGASEIYQDAWDDNTQARGVNAELLNNLVTVRNLVNEVLQARSQMRLSKMSETSKAVKAEAAVNPYSCDPVILEKMQVARERWPQCALIIGGANADSVVAPVSSDAAIANSLAAIQNAAAAAE